jgi:Uma2 family endonuclease
MSTSSASLGLGRLTSEEYHRLIESGAFDENSHVELIDGLLCEMSPRTPEHEQAVENLNRLLALALDHERYRLRPGCALSLGDSEPEPDFAIVERGAPAPYHPAGAKLVIEVAVSSHKRDLEVKPRLYAFAGAEEYWVIDVARGRAFVHREPVDGGYRARIELGSGQVLDGSLVGVGEIPLDAVLAAAPGAAEL